MVNTYAKAVSEEVVSHDKHLKNLKTFLYVFERDLQQMDISNDEKFLLWMRTELAICKVGEAIDAMDILKETLEEV